MTSSDPTPTGHDVFVSYRHTEPDRTWVRQVLTPRLESEGITVCLDVRVFRLGRPVLREMERAVLDSTFTLSVLTPAYEESGFTDVERIMAQHLDAEERRARWLAVILAPVPMRLLDRYRLALDVSDDPADLERLAAALAGAVAELTGDG